MPNSHYLSPLDRRQDARQDVEIKGHIRVVLTTRGHAYINDDATIENLSEHGALLHLCEVSTDHIVALAESPRKCTMLFDSSFPGGLSFLSGDVAWVQVLAEGSRSHAYLGVSLTGAEGRQHGRLCGLLDGLAQSG